MGAAHHFRHHRDLGVVYDGVEVVNDEIAEGGIGEVPQVEDVLDADGLAYLLFNDGFILSENLRGAAADNAEAQNCNVDHGEISFQKKYSPISYHKIEKIAMRGLKKIKKYDRILGHHATGGLFHVISPWK
jgi:hypothetical protein